MAKSKFPYAFGWKPSPPDHRDRFYSAPSRVLRALPAAVDLSVPPLAAPWTPVFDQGSLGSCGPNTTAANLIFAAMKEGTPAPMPSRLFLYYVTRVLMNAVNEDSGVENRAMLKALAQYGWCDEDDWPYTISKFTAKPPQKCFDAAAERAGGIVYLRVHQALDQMRGCLAEGFPFIFGFSVYESLQTAAVERTGRVPYPRQGERQIGGHDVLICGYNDATQEFKFRNSWGTEWGQDGYGYIPYQYAGNPQLAGDFWTVRDAGVMPLPPPPPPPIPPGPTPPSPTPGPTPGSDLLAIFLMFLKWLAERYAQPR